MERNTVESMEQTEDKKSIGEIGGNLGRDVMELLEAIKKLIGEMLHAGYCNLRAIPAKFEELNNTIDAAYDTFFDKPLREYWQKPEDVLPQGNAINDNAFTADAQPIVTVVNSSDPYFRAGAQYTLGEANRMAANIGQQYRQTGSEYVNNSVEFKISYLNGGKLDEYNATINMNGKDIVTQIQENVTAYRNNPETVQDLFNSVPEAFRAKFAEIFAPTITENLEALEKNIIPSLQAHCVLYELEKSAIDTMAVAKLARSMNDPEAAITINHESAMLDYIAECRNLINTETGIAKLPEMPRRDDFTQTAPPARKPEETKRDDKEPKREAQQQRDTARASKVKPVPVRKPSIQRDIKAKQAEIAAKERNTPQRQKGKGRDEL